jgi:hypothetical protein
MTNINDDDIGPLQPRRKTAQDLGKTARTLERWESDPKLNFPQAIKINGRKLDRVREIARWKRERAGGPAS